MSKQVPLLFPGNNGEHLQFDEESITSTHHSSVQNNSKYVWKQTGWVRWGEDIVKSKQPSEKMV